MSAKVVRLIKIGVGDHGTRQRGVVGELAAIVVRQAKAGERLNAVHIDDVVS